MPFQKGTIAEKYFRFTFHKIYPMSEFIELHKLIDNYSKEISEILNGLTDEDMENLDYMYDRLNTECIKRQKKLNDFIHSKYP